MLCATHSGHLRIAEASIHSQDAVGMTHDHRIPLDGASHHAGPQVEKQDAPDTSGKCKVCSECCSAGAPIPFVMSTFPPPDTSLRVSTLVDPNLVSRSGDGLFRPPRTLSI